jgi:hypothetical protein
MSKKKINKDKDHCKRILLRIIAIIKNFGKNILAFWGKNENIYREINGFFLKSNRNDCRIWSSNLRKYSTY